MVLEMFGKTYRITNVNIQGESYIVTYETHELSLSVLTLKSWEEFSAHVFITK